MVAEKLANMSVGRNWANLPDKNTSAEAASKLKVSERTVKSAKKVRATGTPELIDAAEQGSIKVSLAASIANAPEDVQRAVVGK